MCVFTVDHSAGVEAAVLLAPVGGDAGAAREVAHRGRLHVDDLDVKKRRNFYQNERHSGRRCMEESGSLTASCSSCSRQ